MHNRSLNPNLFQKKFKKYLKFDRRKHDLFKPNFEDSDPKSRTT